MKTVVTLIIGLCVGLACNGQVPNVESTKVVDKDLIQLLNSIQLLDEYQTDEYSVKIYERRNESGSAGVSESHQANSNLFIAISEYDEYPRQNLFQIKNLFNPQILTHVTKEDSETVMIKYGIDGDGKRLLAQFDIDELAISELSWEATTPELTEQNTTTTVSTKNGIVLIPGFWETLTYEESSGQYYLKNEEGVILAVAQNPKKWYPFYKSKQSGYETIEAYTNWDIEYQKGNGLQAKILKSAPKGEFQIWKYRDDKNIDNVFLYGSKEDNIINLLIYTSDWTETRKVEFLESAFYLNRN